MSTAEAPGRAGGRQRDPRMDAALVEAVLDLVGGGATLSGLSLSAIAERAGVSRNSLYRRWKTKEALYLVHTNYEAGLATYLDVLNADAQYHQAQIEELQAIAVRYQDTVALFAALGGGWWSTHSQGAQP